jgi:hypothetical protein
MRVIGPDCFATMIPVNRGKVRVQNAFEGERLKLNSLDPFAGEWIHARGTYRETPQITQMNADSEKDKLRKSVKSVDRIVVEIKGPDVAD